MAPAPERLPDPGLTVDEVDEALGWAAALRQRDDAWQTWINGLLDQRLAVARGNR